MFLRERLYAVIVSHFCLQVVLKKQVFPSSFEAIRDIADHSTVIFGGFGVCGTVFMNLISLIYYYHHCT